MRPVAAICALFFTAACSGTRPATLGVTDGRLAVCPSSPNCVSSAATDAEHRVEPFVPTVSSDDAWAALRRALGALPRTTIVTDTDTYLHAECTSALFRFVDDVEAYRDAGGAIAVRSASRIGHSDMGVNRARIDGLRKTLRATGMID